MNSFPAWIVVVAGSMIAVYNGFLWLREIRFLQGILRGLLRRDRIQSRDDLVLIKRFLSEKIAFDLSKKEARRPLFRQSAVATIRNGYGFCGESARAAILLLAVGGVRANRLYLQGERWGHVVVEHLWEGKWRLFDSHADPGTLLPDDAVASVESERLDLFPNAYRDKNPWQSSYRLKPCRRVQALRALDQIRLPAALYLVMESPALMRALFGIAIGFGGLLWLAYK